MEHPIEIKTRQVEYALRDLRSEIEHQSRAIQQQERILGERAQSFEKVLTKLSHSRETVTDPRLALANAKQFTLQLSGERRVTKAIEEKIKNLALAKGEKAEIACAMKQQLDALSLKLQLLKRREKVRAETLESAASNELLALKRVVNSAENTQCRDERRLDDRDSNFSSILVHDLSERDAEVVVPIGASAPPPVELPTVVGSAHPDNALQQQQTDPNHHQAPEYGAPEYSAPERGAPETVEKVNPCSQFAEDISELNSWSANGENGITLRYKLPHGRTVELEVLRDLNGKIAVQIEPEHPRDQFAIWYEKPKILDALRAGGINVDRVIIRRK